MSERQELKVAVAVIGAGSAGLNVFRGAQKHTESVVLIEGGPYGTTCARVGCMPSKLLIAAAEAAHDIKRAHGFGVHAEPPVINGVEVMDRVRRIRESLVVSSLRRGGAVGPDDVAEDRPRGALDA